jgi:hypothetical protein
VKTAKVHIASRHSCMPNQHSGHPVIRIITDISAGQNNSFYIEPEDSAQTPLVLAFDHPAEDHLHDATEMNAGDMIVFDKQAGINRVVIWNGRRFRQRGYSFDTYAGPM